MVHVSLCVCVCVCGSLLSKTFEPTPTLAEKVLCFVGLVPHRGQSPQDVIDVRSVL